MTVPEPLIDRDLLYEMCFVDRKFTGVKNGIAPVKVQNLLKWC